MSPPRDVEHRFVAFLAGLAEQEDRAALAALRRGLGKAPGEAADLYPYLVPWLPRLPANPWQEDAYYLVASLFGWHPLSWRGAEGDGDRARSTNLGVSFARLAGEAEGAGVERRFVALLNADRDDLPEHLRHGVGLLKAHEVPVDWAQLLHDVQGWGWPSRSVQRGWARAFWGRTSGDGGEQEAEAENGSDADVAP